MADNSMEKINRFTRRELSKDEVYTFPVILCDNEIDRDCEKFSLAALKKLAELYIGKTGIFNHDPKGENQTARIYDTEVLTDPARKTADGEEYAYLKAHAYMVKTDSNADLIREIDGGIKKEVSVGCAVAKEVCSVCGRDRRTGECAHKKGRSYHGKKCFFVLDEPTDAYEWSFVAVPAQRSAGVTKRFGESLNGSSADRFTADKSFDCDGSLMDALCDDLRRDIIRLSFLEGDSVPVELTKAAILKMEPDELLKMKRALGEKLEKSDCTECGMGELEKAFNTNNQKDSAENNSFRV